MDQCPRFPTTVCLQRILMIPVRHLVHQLTLGQLSMAMLSSPGGRLLRQVVGTLLHMLVISPASLPILRHNAREIQQVEALVAPFQF
jgi:hypothetical protein